MIDFWCKKRVLITGHTGFKGSWLAIWLHLLGAEVVGYSLDPPTEPSNFAACELGPQLAGDVRGDVRDADHLRRTVADWRPEVIFHLAAQPIVLTGYQRPVETFAANAQGTVHLLDAIRQTPTETARAVVCITTDKVYDNREWVWGYRETDRLGGHDPYSASKAMAELAIDSYRLSFFNAARYDEHHTAVAAARAGNVIGGGDWADYRLVPDTMRAFMAGDPVQLRNPSFVRPWQHVLEPLSGYLQLAQALLKEGPAYAEAWNFGPAERNPMTAEQLVRAAQQMWGGGAYEVVGQPTAVKETTYLKLNWEKAAVRLGWQPTYSGRQALAETVAWYRAYAAGDEEMAAVCRRQIETFMDAASTTNAA